MSHGIDGIYDVYKRTLVHARKRHRCCACEVPILVGDTYVRVYIVFDGSVSTYKRCLRCERIFQTLVEVLEHREQWPDEDLNCGHEWVENGNGPLPDEVAQLAFLTHDEIKALPVPSFRP